MRKNNKKVRLFIKTLSYILLMILIITNIVSATPNFNKPYIIKNTCSTNNNIKTIIYDTNYINLKSEDITTTKHINKISVIPVDEHAVELNINYTIPKNNEVYYDLLKIKNTNQTITIITNKNPCVINKMIETTKKNKTLLTITIIILLIIMFYVTIKSLL